MRNTARYLADSSCIDYRALFLAACPLLLVLAHAAQAQTILVSGIISSDTTWATGTTIIVTGDTLVDVGVNLTIDPNVEVRFEPGMDISLRVDGTLSAIGTAAQKIVFTSNGNPPQKGQWKSIVAFHTVNLQHCIFEYSACGIDIIDINSSVVSSVVSENIFRHNVFGIKIGVTNLSTFPSVTFTDNLIHDNNTGVAAHDGTVIALRNIFVENNLAWGDGNGSLNLTFEHNLVFGNGMGMDFRQGSSGVSVMFNTIVNNGTLGIGAGHFTPPSPVFAFNNIFGNDVDFWVKESIFTVLNNIQAENNYWGTTDLTEIDNNIFDRIDDFNLSRVDFDPIEISFVTTAPALPLPPTITTQPQDATVDSGTNVQFTIVASSPLPLLFQWQHDGLDIPNATAPFLSLTNISPADNGGYLCLVSNVAGTTSSSTAQLVVNPPPIPAVATWGLGLLVVLVMCMGFVVLIRSPQAKRDLR